MRHRPRSLSDLLAANLDRTDPIPAESVDLLIPRYRPEGRYVAGATDGFRKLQIPAPQMN